MKHKSSNKRCLRFRKAILLSASALLVSGCASLGKSECLSGDWGLFGNSDGIDGKVAGTQLKAHNKACSKHSVRVDQSAYMVGYKDGLKTYCTTENGYNVGSKFGDNTFRKSGYQDVCPDDLELPFLEGYVSALKFKLDTAHKEMMDEKGELETNRSALLILQILNSSKAENLEEEVDSGDDSVSEKQSTIDATVKEIEKWLYAKPELKSVLEEFSNN